MSVETTAHQPTQSSKLWLYVNIAIGVALILAGVAVLFLMDKEPAATSTVAVSPHQGKAAPDFSLPSLAGETVALSNYKGQVVLINLWATWCPPCKAEMPTLNAYYQANKDKGFVVLAVNDQEDAITVNNFIEANGFGFPVLLDTQSRVLDTYNVRALPTTFVIDRNGVIQYVHMGEISQQQLEEIVGPLL